MQLTRRLWSGDVPAALQVIEREHARARPSSNLRRFAEYLRARQGYIPSYSERQQAGQYIGSGQAEKANDLLVTCRQKGRGMHWGADWCDALAALQTVRLNQEWDRYWIAERLADNCSAAAQSTSFARQREIVLFETSSGTTLSEPK